MEAIIKEVYESNFGNAYETYKKAVKKDNSIRLQDVKDYLNSLESVQVKYKPETSNSFVSPGANFEYEILWTSKLKVLHLMLVMVLSLSIILLRLPR